MEDVTPGLLKKIQDSFRAELNESATIKGLYEKVRNGAATYAEANDFAIEVGDILARAYKNSLSSDVLPDGRMYFNIAQSIIDPTMKNNYSLITDITAQVQQALNTSANIGIKPITPKLNQNRIDGIINRVSAAEHFDDVSWILDEPVRNFSQSIVDDSIRENAEFHAKAGMTPKIVRKLMGGCCDWCQSLAGTYSYPDVPKDIYRRHQRCRCTVDYNPGNGKIQNVHSKKWRSENSEKLEERKKIGLSKKTSKDEILSKIHNKGLEKYDLAVANEPAITEKVKEVADDIGLEPYGLENRIKSRKRYAEKLEANLSNGKKEVNDILRYTLGTEKPAELVEKMNAAIEKFSDSGYNTTVLKNTWNDSMNPYKGVNTTVVTPGNQKFEMQYHTKESYDAKENMHKLYEKQRVISDISSEEYMNLTEEMFKISDKLTKLKGIEGVDSFG